MLHFSSFAETLPYLAVALFLFYSCGYVSLNKILRVNLRKTYGTLISLPIYLSAGIVLCTFILYAIGLVIFNQLIVYMVTILIVASFLAKLLLSARRSGSTGMKMALEKLRGYNATTLPSAVEKMLPSLIAGLVFVISFLYLTNVIAIFEWPPKGDIISHGFYTSLIIYDQRIPTNFYPFINADFHYPLGLHVNAAFLAVILGIYPGEAVLLLGGILMIALTSLVFTLTYIITRSKLLSCLPCVLLYLAYSANGSGGYLELWVFGYLFNGTYPSLYGFLIVLLSITTIIIHAKTKDRYVLSRLYPILIIVLLLTYPNLLFVSLMLFIFAVLQVGLKITIDSCFATRRDTLVTIILAVSFMYFALYIYFGIFSVYAHGGVFSTAMYVIPEEYLLNSVFGYSIVFAFTLSCILIAFSFKESGFLSTFFEPRELVELRPVLLAYILTTLILFSSLNTELYNLLQYLLPRRLGVLAMMFSLVLNVYALTKIFSALTEGLVRSAFLEKRCMPSFLKKLIRATVAAKLRRVGFARTAHRSTVGRRLDRCALEKGVPLTRNLAVALIVVAFFSANGLLVYSLRSQATFSFAHDWAWLSHTYWFKDDFSGMEWIHNNVGYEDLILNDFSFDGLYLTSLSAKNVSMQYVLLSLNRTRELQNIWLDPQNAKLVYSLLKKYNVSYVFTTSEWAYIDALHDWSYKAKPYRTFRYVQFFSNYTFLEMVFGSGDTAVFKVI